MDAILVLDKMPESCSQCEIFNFSDLTCLGCKVNFKDVGKVQSWCPLKPLPQKNKYDVEKYATVDYENNVNLGHYLNKGWNDCIDEILGENE